MGLPRHYTDEQVAEFERHPDYIRAGGRCPVCKGSGSYLFEGEVRECPDDDYGHPALRLFKLYCLGNLPLEFQQLDWSKYPYPEVVEKAEKYIENFDTIRFAGLGWEIMGKRFGIGKSFLAAHLLKATLLRGHSGWWIQFADLKRVYEAETAEKHRITRKVMDSEVLVIDDVLKPRSERERDFYEDQLEQVVRHRTSRNLPTITTTNMIEEDLEELMPRVYSLLSAKQIRLELDGSDHRREVWRENQELLLNGEVRPLTLA